MERRFTGRIHRKGKESKLVERHYATLDNAVSRLSDFMIRYGAPGDVAEVYSKLTQRQMATVRVHAGGRFSTWKSWEE